MKISKEAQAQARRLLRLCLDADGLLNEDNVRLITARLLEAKPRNYMMILSALRELLRLEEERHLVRVSSAIELQPQEKEAIQNKLNARHKGLHYLWETDPSLIAGIRVKVGDQVTDASVKARIERLSQI